MRIFIVSGSSGEYSDRREWLVAAYTEESKARSHVEMATARANEIYSKWSASGGYALGEPDTNEYDQNMQMIWLDGARYYIEECELIA